MSDCGVQERGFNFKYTSEPHTRTCSNLNESISHLGADAALSLTTGSSNHVQECIELEAGLWVKIHCPSLHRYACKSCVHSLQFMLRQEVLKLYRDIFRTIRRVPDRTNQEELKEWARRDFRANRQHTDEVVIKMMLHSGNRSLTELKSSLGLVGC